MGPGWAAAGAGEAGRPGNSPPPPGLGQGVSLQGLLPSGPQPCLERNSSQRYSPGRAEPRPHVLPLGSLRPIPDLTPSASCPPIFTLAPLGNAGSLPNLHLGQAQPLYHIPQGKPPGQAGNWLPKETGHALYSSQAPWPHLATPRAPPVASPALCSPQTSKLPHPTAPAAQEPAALQRHPGVHPPVLRRGLPAPTTPIS